MMRPRLTSKGGPHGMQRDGESCSFVDGNGSSVSEGRPMRERE